MKFKRTLYRTTLTDSDHEWETFTEEYEQPLVNRLVFLAYHAWWLMLWKVRPISKLVTLADDIVLKLHKRHCSGDCGMWTIAATGEQKPGCVYMPLNARIDIKHFHLDNKNNKRL